MTSDNHLSSLFPEAEQNWQLEKLYADLEQLNHKSLKPIEKACLRGLLCRYRPGQLSFKCNWTSGALRVELNKGLYRYIEELTGHAANTLRWELVGDWLAAYKKEDSSTQQDWGEAPQIKELWGREQELQTLTKLIFVDRCRQLCLWGMGGIGKTALAVKLAEQVSHDFDYLIWRSLKYMPSLSQLIDDICRFLPNSPNFQGDQLSQFMEVCKTQRCLIVIDDFETVLQDGALVGNYRFGYENYGTFLERSGTARHQSCVVIISREQPRQIVLMQGEYVQSYKLKGLNPQGAIALLKTRGYSGTEAGLEQLVQQYRGNPAALKIVTSTIDELFDRNIAAFLKQTALVLGDVFQSLLYEQFERLSPLEKNIIYWLALKRRPTSLAELRTDIINSGSEILAALESLHWRSLIERNLEGETVLFCLEPVLTKYVNKKFVEQIITELQTKQISSLLQTHSLVEDYAPDAIRAAQIRLTLKPIKDAIATQNVEIKQILAKSIPQGKFTEANLTLLGVWL